MGRLLRKPQSRDLLLGAMLVLAALALVLWPREAMESVKAGLKLCGNVIVPSLFPFFVLSFLVVELGMSRYLGRLMQPLMVPLFRVNGACASALALGVIGGYPVGARTAIALYESGQCSRTEAERLLAFCNNSGPAFILGVVGAGVFGSGTMGLLLYLTHILASLCVGLLFRFYRPGEGPRSHRERGAQFQTARFSLAFTRSVTGAAQSSLNICAFVLLFAVVIRLLTLAGILDLLAAGLAALFSPLGFTQEWARRLLTGLLEISSGVSSLSGGSLTGRMSMAAFMLGWAGLSVHCQVLSFLGDSGLSMGTYFVGKLLHGLFSAALLAALTRLIPLDAPVGAYLAQQTQALAVVDFSQALTISLLWAWWVWLAFLAAAVWVVKKSSGKAWRQSV